MERFYYGKTIAEFLAEEPAAIFGALSQAESFDTARDQKNAWNEEIGLLKSILQGYNGDVFFEYSIPRLGKRVDVILLINGVVLCLEFKAGAERFETADKEQVWDYALDLKNFHEPSRDLFVAPVLVATDAPDEPFELATCNYDDKVYAPLQANASTLKEAIVKVVDATPKANVEGMNWARGRYSPTPTIIQAASAVYAKHNVENITRCDAGENLKVTTDFILGVIDHAKANNEKCICFVTGVPGAGKTLVGLNVAMKQFEKKEPAVYLSGNKPLILKEKYKRGSNSLGKDGAGLGLYLSDHFMGLMDGKLEIDEAKTKKHEEDGYSEVEHVAIFDEAQRLWDQPHLSAWLARKKGVQNFPMSESEFLIWSLDLRPDWAVVVCLVGGGQEINSGEAGIAEPIRAANDTFPNWNVFISPQLIAKEYAEGNVDALLKTNPKVQKDVSLHLATSMRSFRAENLSNFVGQLLDRDVSAAKTTYAEFCANYPIMLTRDLAKAKAWLRKVSGGSERYGMICSSQAFRLRPLAIDVRAKPNIVDWFLDDITDIRSSLFLEDVATEFDIQGLELDWSCLIWDGDFQYAPEGWIQKDFSGGKWKNINAPERRAFQVNAYRVLLTRARKGMIICVPEGDRGHPPDDTRRPEFYDETYKYLCSLGLKVLV